MLYQVIEERLRSSFPTASALALEPRHVLGIGVEELSVSQLEALEEVHRTLMMKAGEVCFSFAQK